MKKKIIKMDKVLEAMCFSEDEYPRQCGSYPEFCQTMMICVDTFADGVAEGRLHCYFFEEAQHFWSLDQLLFAIEDILDRTGTIMRDSTYRTFYNQKEQNQKNYLHSLLDFDPQPDKNFYTMETIRVKPGNIASFYIRVVTRRHCSMQGVISKGGPRSTVAFRSGMELLHLLKDALEKAEKK